VAIMQGILPIGATAPYQGAGQAINAAAPHVSGGNYAQYSVFTRERLGRMAVPTPSLMTAARATGVNPFETTISQQQQQQQQQQAREREGAPIRFAQSTLHATGFDVHGMRLPSGVPRSSTAETEQASSLAEAAVNASIEPAASHGASIAAGMASSPSPSSAPLESSPLSGRTSPTDPGILSSPTTSVLIDEEEGGSDDAQGSRKQSDADESIPQGVSARTTEEE
jgi:hypothetical protein